MSIKMFHLKQFIALLALLSASALSQAQIYKCVDQNGKTHYSEKKENACNATASPVKLYTKAGPTATPEESAKHWGEQERLRKQRQLEDQYSQKRYGPPIGTRPKSLSGGQSGKSDQSKCNLARDILNGSVVHTNGKPTDEYDRRIARRDVEKYCH